MEANGVVFIDFVMGIDTSCIVNESPSIEPEE